MNLLERFLRVVIIICLMIMTAVVTLQIITRYFFDHPIGWSEEVTRYLFIYLTFLTAAVGIRQSIHIGLDILTERLSGVPKKILSHIVNVLLILFLIVLVYFGMKLSIDNWTQKSPALSLPIGMFYAAIPISSIISILFILESIFKQKGEEIT